MPNHHLLNGLFSHGGKEKYPPAALNWVLAVPNLIQNIDTEKTNQLLNLRFTSHIEGYVSAIQEQEIETKETRKRRVKNPEIKRNMNTKCRTCNKFDEAVFHLICSCPALAPTLYLNMRHNQVARILYQEIIQNENMIYKPPPVTKKNNLEIWWDKSITTATRVEKNWPDIIIWDTTSKICKIVDAGVPLDTNPENVYQDKKSKYIPLIGQMQQIYKDYKFMAIAITVGCLGSVPKKLPEELKQIPFNDEKLKLLIPRMQKAAILRTVHICKTTMKM